MTRKQHLQKLPLQKSIVYFTGFLPIRGCKFHLFSDKNGIVSICGRKKAISSGHATLEKIDNKFHLRTPVHKEDLNFKESDFCTNCLSKMK